MGTAVALLLYAVALLGASAAVWRRPVLALYLFVVGLALHNAAMAVLYGLGIRGAALTAIQAWKDVLLAVAIASVGAAAWRARRMPFRPGRVDVLALGFAALVLLYAVLPQHLLGGGAGPKGILYALRHDLSPVAAYFVGRSLALSRPELRRFAWTVLGVAAAVAAFGLVEEYAVSLDWWARHGAVGYFHDQLGFDYHGPRRLPENFVFNSGNEQELARRLVSTFLSPLGASYLFVVGLLVAACVGVRRRLALGLAGLVAVGLLFTFSRASIAAAALGLCFVALVLRRPWTIAAAATLAVVGVGFAQVFPDVAPRAHWTKQELVEQRKHARENGGTAGTGLGESSTRSHLTNLRAGVRTVVHHPEGFGLGNAGMVASRTHVKLKARESATRIGWAPVSLTGELNKKDSPVTRWFAERVTNIKPISDEWNAAVKAAPLIRSETDRRIPGTIGTAFDYRLRYWFAVTPLEDLIASAGMRQLSPDASPITSRRGAPDAFLALRGSAPDESAAVVALLADFAASLEKTVTAIDPVGGLRDDADEQLLCRHCYVLGLFEELFRAGPRIRSPLYELADDATVDDLLALPPQAWIDDLCALSAAFADHYSALAGRPVVLNPTFAGSAEIGGADADLIVDGCLLDVKTTVDPKFTRTRVLYQFLGYTLLDHDDRYGIDAVGVYLSRHSLLLRWPLLPLWRTLLENDAVDLADLRSSFREAVLAARVDPVAEVTHRRGASE